MIGAQQVLRFPTLQPIDADIIRNLVSLTLPVDMDRVGNQVIDPLKLFTHAQRPVNGRTVNIQNVLYLVEDLNRITDVAVQLVDEGKYRRVPQPANFHQIDGPLFHTLGTIDHHQRRVDCGEHPVGILRKVFMARRV